MFRRKVALPDPVRRQIREITTERVLALAHGQHASLIDEGEESANVAHATVEDSPAETLEYVVSDVKVTVAATARRLIAVASGVGGESGSVEGFWWHEIDRASWVAEERIIRVSFTTADEELILQVGVDLPMEFLSILRDRVENSVVLSETIALTSAENVRVAVRRDEVGDIFVEVLYDDGIDPNHPVVMKKVAPVVARLREVSGAR